MPFIGSQPAETALSSGDLGADIVTGAKIADDQINSEHYVDGSIDAAHIAGALHTIWVPASSMRPAGTNGCADIAVVDSGSNSGPDMQVLDFDKASEEFAQFSVAMPKSWDNDEITYQVYWIGLAATTTCIWGLQVKALGDGETTDVAYGSAVTVTDVSQGSAVELLVSPVSSAIACGGATSDLLYCQVKRDADDGSDNLDGDARLVGIKIFYTTNTGGDT